VKGEGEERGKEKRHRRERKERAQLLPNKHSPKKLPHLLLPQNHHL
jgi:hypothetical protein